MNKIVIIINGNGGVGKDTLCDFAGEFYNVLSISSITPIKEIASKYGWDGQKDSKSRKFLSDLKKVFVEYNDLPFIYLVNEYNKFLNDKNEILFVHVREAQEIKKFREFVTIPCVTLLVRRKEVDKINWGNESDNNVEKCDYDYYYDNDKKLIEAKQDFKIFIENIISDIFCKKDTPTKKRLTDFWGTKSNCSKLIENFLGSVNANSFKN